MADLGCDLGDDRRVGGRSRRSRRTRPVPSSSLAQDVLARDFGPRPVGQVARVLVHAAAIAAQPLGDVLGGVVEGAVRIRGLPLPAQVRPRPACRLMSQVKKLRARLNVTCASSAWSKYLLAIASRCSATRSGARRTIRPACRKP